MTSDLTELAYLGVECPACGAPPGQWCVTYRPTRREPGRRAVWLHEPRTSILNEAWRIGYRQGQNMALGNVLYHLEAANAAAYWALKNNVPTGTPEPVLRWLREQQDRVGG